MAKSIVSHDSLIKSTEICDRTRFEDLSNELFYEIFDYLDNCYTYETFYNLNIRFQYLIINSKLPLKLYFNLLSKSTFEYQCKTIILPNLYRIISLHLSDHLIIDYLLNLIPFSSSFIRLENLILDNIRFDNLITILTKLKSLPCLYSLTIKCIEKIRSREIIYCLIIGLPVLKYWKLSLDTFKQDVDLFLNTSISTSIEYLIIDSKCDLNEIIEVLSYTPKLQYLSCKISTINQSLLDMSFMLINLNKICLELEEISFDEFQWFISSISQHIQIMKISTKDDNEYLNADRWEQLIVSQMPNLSKFSLQYQTIIRNDIDQYILLMDKFRSPFWLKRKWFFTHQYYKSKNLSYWLKFYSIEPYRWNHYEFHEDICQHHDNGINLAYEVDLHNYDIDTLNVMKFPRTNRLILSKGNIAENTIFINNLNRMFSYLRLKEFVISDENFRLEQLLFLLDQFPNVKSLSISTNILNFSIPQTGTNRLISHRTNLLKISILNRCTMEDIQIVNRLFPYIQSLEIEVERDQLEMILRFILLKNTNQTHRNVRFSTQLSPKNMRFWQNEYSNCIRCTKNQDFNTNLLHCNHHLCSLCCRDVSYRMIEKFRTIINEEILLKNYSIEYVDQNMYLWW